MANINQSMQEVIGELKSKAIYDQRGDLANVIGSPAVGTDSVPVLLSKLQTNKNNLASNLGSKGVTASGTESVESLVGKVGDISLGKKWASGTGTAVYSNYYATITISNLAFKPAFIILDFTIKHTDGRTYRGRYTYRSDTNLYEINSILIQMYSNNQPYVIIDTLCTISNNGFSFKFPSNSSDIINSITWIAFE